MRKIELDAARWASIDDVYEALLPAIGAPEWHGHNVNALIDSMIWGGINAIDPPYTVVVRGVAHASVDIRAHLEVIRRALVEARAEFATRRGHELNVEFETAP